MNANEPVAWMAVNELNGSYITFTNDQKQRLLPHVSQCYGKWIPLYTHPAKELTYEDGIEECANRAEAYTYMSPNFTALAEELRAILRKAQE